MYSIPCTELHRVIAATCEFIHTEVDSFVCVGMSDWKLSNGEYGILKSTKTTNIKLARNKPTQNANEFFIFHF
jgi:hypothetical protein